MDVYDFKFKIMSLFKKSKLHYNDPLLSEWMVLMGGLRQREQAVWIDHLITESVKRNEITNITGLLVAFAASRAAAEKHNTIFGEQYQKEVEAMVDRMAEQAKAEIRIMLHGDDQEKW